MRVFDKDPKADHPHQRSIWIGWGDVNGANHWTQSPENTAATSSSPKSPPTPSPKNSPGIPKAQPPPSSPETRTVKCSASTPTAPARFLDITSTFTAPTVDAVFKCKPLSVSGVEAGIASLRIAKAITDAPDDKKWITSAPDPLPPGAYLAPSPHRHRRSRRPQNTRRLVRLLPASSTATPFGAALINSPKNSGGLVPFHVRLSSASSPTIGPLNFTIKKGDSLTAPRHLLLFHPGNAADAHVADRANEWQHPTQ